MGDADADPPLVSELGRVQATDQVSFHMPGHRSGTGRMSPGASVLGPAAYAADVSEMGGFDYLHAPTGAMGRAQAAAAALYGAAHTRFLVNGTTGGNQAALLALIGDGDTLAMLRGSHRSVYGAAVLTGARPAYVPMLHDHDQDGWFVGDAGALEALTSVRAIHVTRPNYYGMACDLAPYVAAARRWGVPLVVDEAHGAHFGLHPALPGSALAAGADVVVQSTHKTLGSLTQSSMLHVREGAAVDIDVIDRALQLLQSSSPSTLLTLSLDLARHDAATGRREHFERVVALADEARAAALAAGLVVPAPPAGVTALDPTRVVLDVSPLGLSGFAASTQLRERHRVGVELADHRRIVCSLTPADTPAMVGRLVAALQDLRPDPFGRVTAGPPMPVPDVVEPPRGALRARSEAVPLAAAIGRVSAEYVVPYPPGVPLVVPGERLHTETLEAIVAVRRTGWRIVGPADRSGGLIRVLA